MIRETFRQDETWIAVDPIVGCPINCQYCFLQSYGETPKKGTQLLSAEETINQLTKFTTYRNDSVLMIGSETDMFSSKANIAFATEFVTKYDNANIGNPLVFVTKRKIPDEFIELTNNLRNTKVLFYLSFSGMPKEIEPNVNIEDIKENFIRLAQAGNPAIHYWRPFTPHNSSVEKMSEIIDFVRRYARCTVTSGLKLNSDLQELFWFWPELKNAQLDLSNIAAIWPEGVKEFLEGYVANNYPSYPLFYTNSCAISYILGIPEFDGIYGSPQCENNHCPDTQRAICNTSLRNYQPSVEDIAHAKVALGIEISMELDKEQGIVRVQGDIEHGQLIFLRQILKYPVISDSYLKSNHEWGGAAIGRKDLIFPIRQTHVNR